MVGTDVAATVLFDGKLASLVKKGFFNSLGVQNNLSRSLYNKFIDPNFNGDEYGPKSGDRVLIASTLPDFPYYGYEEGQDITEGRYFSVGSNLISEIVSVQTGDNENPYHFIAKIIDIDAPAEIFGKLVILRFEDFIISPDHMFLDFLLDNNVLGWLKGTDISLSEKDSDFLNKMGFNDDDINPLKVIFPSSIFMSPYASEAGAIKAGITGGAIPTGNPFVRAFNSSKGRGLAGFISSFSMDLLSDDASWDTELNSRAPKLLKITIGFSPVHDITPGIDHSGFNTATFYNVGEIMSSVSGDVWGSKRKLAKKAFKSARGQS